MSHIKNNHNPKYRKDVKQVEFFIHCKQLKCQKNYPSASTKANKCIDCNLEIPPYLQSYLKHMMCPSENKSRMFLHIPKTLLLSIFCQQESG